MVFSPVVIVSKRTRRQRNEWVPRSNSFLSVEPVFAATSFFNFLPPGGYGERELLPCVLVNVKNEYRLVGLMLP